MIGTKINREALISARKRRCWTQQQAADKIGCSRFSLIKYEDGKSQPTQDMLSKIAGAYDVSVSTLTTQDSFNAYVALLNLLERIENCSPIMIDDRALDDEGRERLRFMIDMALDYLARRYHELKP